MEWPAEKSTQKVYETLQKMVGLYRQLMDVIRAEKDALIEVNVKEVQNTTHLKEALISALRHCENERVIEVQRFALASKVPVDGLTLEKLIIHVQGHDLKKADQLRSVLNTLRVLTGRLSIQNKENEKLASRFLEHLNQMKTNVLGEAAPETEVYSSKGAKIRNTGGSRLITQEA